MTAFFRAHKKKITTISLWAISLLCLSYAFLHVDAALMWSAIKAYPPSSISFLTLWILGMFAAATIRKYLLFLGKISLKKALKSSLLYVGGNNILPARAGDVIQTLYLLRTADIPKEEILALLFWERFIDLHVLILFSAFAFSVLDQAPWLFGLIGCLILGMWISVYILRYRQDWLFRLLDYLPWKRPLTFTRQFSVAIRTRYGFRWIVCLLFGTALQWFCVIGFYTFAFIFVAELLLSYVDALCASCALCLSAFIPALPGNIGVFEAAVVFVLKLFNINRSEALAIGLACHCVLLVVSLVGIGFAVCIDKQAKNIVVEEIESGEDDAQL